MKPIILLRSAILAVALTFVVTGCQNSGSQGGSVAGSSGPGGGNDARSSGTGPGGHAAATNPSHVGPSGAGPAGSQ